MTNKYYIGVDVGTGSARAALVDQNGIVQKMCVKDIQTWNVKPDYYEQSSSNIWNSCVYCIKEVIKHVDDKYNIKGIGFDATCSLVVLDKDGKPLSVTPSGDDNQNIILWMDHRSYAEAEKINKTNHEVLKYVGDKISLELEIPKILWLRNNLLKENWDNIGYLFDLPDFLTWKATNSTTRSLCSLVCKWNYYCTETTRGWNDDFLIRIGLGSLIENDYGLIGNCVQAPGSAVGHGLSAAIAQQLGLPVGVPVGTSIIDAHAGGLGMVHCRVEGVACTAERRLGLICGTSTCHMASSLRPTFAPGVWGPYYSAMVPGLWLNEGGQSATGRLIDHIIETHPAVAGITPKLGKMHIQEYLTHLLKRLQTHNNLKYEDFLTQDLHIWPDFHGNRSPIADSTLTGMISGLTLSTDENDLAVMYLAIIQALAYGTRHIIDSLISAGHDHFESIVICGGLSKNPLFVQTQADVVGLPVICPDEPESVLVGAAILGALASGLEDYQGMSGMGKLVMPNADVKAYHDKKYRVFLMMLEHQKEYSKVMRG